MATKAGSVRPERGVWKPMSGVRNLIFARHTTPVSAISGQRTLRGESTRLGALNRGDRAAAAEDRPATRRQGPAREKRAPISVKWSPVTRLSVEFPNGEFCPGGRAATASARRCAGGRRNRQRDATPTRGAPRQGRPNDRPASQGSPRARSRNRARRRCLPEAPTMRCGPIVDARASRCLRCRSTTSGDGEGMVIRFEIENNTGIPKMEGGCVRRRGLLHRHRRTAGPRYLTISALTAKRPPRARLRCGAGGGEAGLAGSGSVSVAPLPAEAVRRWRSAHGCLVGGWPPRRLPRAWPGRASVLGQIRRSGTRQIGRVTGDHFTDYWLALFWLGAGLPSGSRRFLAAQPRSRVSMAPILSIRRVQRRLVPENRRDRRRCRNWRCARRTHWLSGHHLLGRTEAALSHIVSWIVRCSWPRRQSLRNTMVATTNPLLKPGRRHRTPLSSAISCWH